MLAAILGESDTAATRMPTFAKLQRDAATPLPSPLGIGLDDAERACSLGLLLGIFPLGPLSSAFSSPPSFSSSKLRRLRSAASASARRCSSSRRRFSSSDLFSSASRRRLSSPAAFWARASFSILLHTARSSASIIVRSWLSRRSISISASSEATLQRRSKCPRSVPCNTNTATSPSQPRCWP